MKNKFLRLKTIFLAILMSFISTGCTNEEKIERSYSNSEALTNNESLEDVQNEQLCEKENLEAKVEEDFDTKTINQILEYYENTNMPYRCYDYFLSDAEINKILKNADSTIECSNNMNVDLDQLKKAIYENSRQYCISHPEYCSAFFSEETYDEEMNEAQVLNLFYLNDILLKIQQSHYSDSNEDFCKLSDISIVLSRKNHSNSNSDNFILAEYIDDEELIIIYYNSLKQCNNFEEELQRTLEHEMNHVRQYACDHRLENGQLYEIINYQDNIPFIIESSAESETYAMSNHPNIHGRFDGNFDLMLETEHYNYLIEREQESVLLLLNLFKTDKKIEDFYSAIYDCDYNKFFDFFDVSSIEQTKFLMDIIYNIDAPHFRNNFAYSYYGNLETITNKDIEGDIGYTYLSRIFNKVLKDMIYYTMEDEEFTLEDNLIMFNVVKESIISFPYTVKKEAGEYIYVYDDNIVQYIYDAENKYVEFLQVYYGVTEEEIRNLEKNEIVDILDQMNFPILIDDTAVYKLNKLMEKFPLLRYIIFTNLHLDSYDRFLNNNSELIKKLK